MLGRSCDVSLLGALIATAPMTANAPGGAAKVVLFNAFFVALWIVSSAFFRAASKRDLSVVAAH